MAKKSTPPFSQVKGILANKKNATTKKGNNPSPVAKQYSGKNKKMC